ncbi:NmrA family transcriptional regulator, partial [Nostoc sp. 3335mG]
VVIDVSNSPSPDAAMEYFEASSHNLLVAGAAAGVGHHVALSIVGVDRVPGQGYYRAKLAQEALIQASGIPYTIVRATQFMEFLGAIADGSTDKGVVRLPQGLLQPVAAGDVAAFVAEIAVGDPRNGIVEMAGPERAPFGEIVGRYLKAIGDKRDVLSDPEARYFGGKLEETSLVPLGAAHLGGVDLNDWVRRLPGRL